MDLCELVILFITNHSTLSNIHVLKAVYKYKKPEKNHLFQFFTGFTSGRYPIFSTTEQHRGYT